MKGVIARVLRKPWFAKLTRFVLGFAVPVVIVSLVITLLKRLHLSGEVRAMLYGGVFILIWAYGRWETARLPTQTRTFTPDDFDTFAREQGSQATFVKWTTSARQRESSFRGLAIVLLLLSLCGFVLGGIAGVVTIFVASCLVLYPFWLVYRCPEIVADSGGLRLRTFFGARVVFWNEVTRAELVQQAVVKNAPADRSIFVILRGPDNRKVFLLPLRYKFSWQSDPLLYFISLKLAEREASAARNNLTF